MQTDQDKPSGWRRRLQSLAFDPWQRDLALATLPAVALFAVCAFSPSFFGDGDTNWHVAAGRWILAHRTIPSVDPFSYTFLGRPWHAHEWLSEVLFALAYAGAGWSGVGMLAAAAAAGSAAVVAWVLRARLGTLSVVAMLGLSFAVLKIALLARPHVLAWLPLTIWTAALLDARRRDARPTYWLIPVMLVWANLHGSFIVGLGIAGAFALEALLSARGRRLNTALAWGGFLLAAAAASLATPHGLEGWLFPVQVMGMKTLTSIIEWRATDFTKLGAVEVALAATLFVCLYRGVRVSAVRLALLILVLHMALSQMRHAGLLALLAPLLLADGLADTLEPNRQDGRSRPRPALSEIAGPLMVAVVLLASVIAARLIQPVVRVDNVHTPVTALGRTPAALTSQPVFNDYSFGGWLIFKGVRPFIDGRADMYGDDFMRRYLAISRGDAAAFDRGVRQYGFRWTILPPTSRLAKLLDTRRDWRRIYADKYAVVHVRGPAVASR